MKLSLHNQDLWKKFREHNTEMKVTKTGRRMCPVISVSFEDLHPRHLYVVMVDFVSVDDYKYNFDVKSKNWVACRKKIRKEYLRMYTHPATPASGASLMRNALTFKTLKLTNNVKLSLNDTNVILLNTMCRYIPRVHVVECIDGINFNWKSQRKFSFPDAEFIAVSYYRNRQIAQLKINTNPFATAFRSQGLHGKAKRLRVDSKTVEGNANSSEGTGLRSTGTSLKERSTSDNELKSNEVVCTSKSSQESASMENCCAGLQLKKSWFSSSAQKGRENGTKKSEPQHSDQTTSMKQSTQSGVLQEGEFLLYCNERLPDDEGSENGEMIQGNRPLFGKMNKVSIATQERRNAEDFASEDVVKKLCQRRKQHAPRRVCKATSGYSLDLNFNYKSSEGRLNTAEIRKLLHQLTPSKPRDNTRKQNVHSQGLLSEKTPVSPSGRTPVSCSAETPVYYPAETVPGCSGGTPVSPSVETPALRSGGTPVSCSRGVPVSPSVETPASCSGVTPISWSRQIPVSSSVETPASCSGGTPVSCAGGTPSDGKAVSHSEGSSIVGVKSRPVFSGSVVQSESSELRDTQPSCQQSAILIGAQSAARQTLSASQNYTIPLLKELVGNIVSYSKVSGGTHFCCHPVLPSSKQSETVRHTGFTPILAQTTGMDHQTTGMDRQTTGMDHQTTGMDRQTTGMDHQTTGMDHQTTGMDRQTTGMDHQTTGMDRQTTGMDHQTTGMDHQTTGMDHQTTRMDHQTIRMDHQTTGMDHQTTGPPNDCYNSISSVAGVTSATYVADPFSVSKGSIPSTISNSAISGEIRHNHSRNVSPNSWGSSPRGLVRISPPKVKNVPASDASSSFFPMIFPTFSYKSLLSGYSSVTGSRDRQIAVDKCPMNTSDGMYNPVILNSFTIGASHRFFQVGDGYGAYGESVEKEMQRIHFSENSLTSSVSRDGQACFAGHTNLVQSVNCGLVDLNSTIHASPISLETFYSFSTKSSQENPLHGKPRMRHYKPTRTIFSRWSLEPVSSVISPPERDPQQ